jgi:hypothetical protein
MRRFFPVLAGVVAGVTIVGGLIGAGRMTAGGQDGTGGHETVRWVNVEIDAPQDDSPLRVMRDLPRSEEHSLHLLRIVLKDTPPPPAPAEEALWSEPEVRIDAETGEVLNDTLTQDSAEAQMLLDSLRVVTGVPEAWPYTDGPVPAETVRLENLVYPLPPPASGLTTAEVVANCVDPCHPVQLLLASTQSMLWIYADTGEVDSWEDVASDEREAFERFVAATEVPGNQDAAAPTTGFGGDDAGGAVLEGVVDGLHHLVGELDRHAAIASTHWK